MSVLDNVGSYETSPRPGTSKEYCLPETPRKSGLKRRLSSSRLTLRIKKSKCYFMVVKFYLVLWNNEITGCSRNKNKKGFFPFSHTMLVRCICEQTCKH